MRDLFSGYYKLTKAEFDSLWQNAIFVFDTNVLLNLYRYQTSTRDSLISIIEKLSDRVWIPYHVGLEFQRNRLTVIAEQHKRYSEVQDIIEKCTSTMKTQLDGLQLKKRHSHINPDKLLENVDKVTSQFFQELNEMEENNRGVLAEDEIRAKIDVLFENRVGSSPKDQKTVDKLFADAEVRYKNATPPGFRDSKKDDKDPDEFTYGGIVYKRKYGDIIVWSQILEYASTESLKDVIFITDDNKSDWWWKVESRGKKTIGVRPELVDEIQRVAGVDRFYAYNTEGFLNFAKELLGAQVTEDVIEEVREVSIARRSKNLDIIRSRHFIKSAEQAVLRWLKNHFTDIEENHNGSPDFISHSGKGKYGFEVKLIREPRMIFHRLKEIMYQSYYLLNEEKYLNITLILVVLEEEHVAELIKHLRRRALKMKGNLTILIGKGEVDEDDFIYRFIPYDDFRFSEFS